MGLKIIGAGFGRTGTQSLKQAIEMLGFGPCHHMYEVRNSPRQIDLWRAIAQGSPADWDEVFAGYSAQVDWPAAAYWRQLATHFPESKVILTLREPGAWFESMLQTIVPSSTIGAEQDPDPNGRAGSEIIREIVLKGVFAGRMADREYALRRFAQHRQDVVDAIPAERLLVFDVRDGWEPLCAFLDSPVPEVPFPSSNTVSDFRARKSYLAPKG